MIHLTHGHGPVALDPKVVFVREPGEACSISHIGIGEVRRLLEGECGEWETCGFDLDEVKAVDADRVLACGRVTARGRGDAAGVELPFAALWTVRDRKAVRVESYRHREEALTALKRALTD